MKYMITRWENGQINTVMVDELLLHTTLKVSENELRSRNYYPQYYKQKIMDTLLSEISEAIEIVYKQLPEGGQLYHGQIRVMSEFFNRTNKELEDRIAYLEKDLKMYGIEYDTLEAQSNIDKQIIKDLQNKYNKTLHIACISFIFSVSLLIYTILT